MERHEVWPGTSNEIIKPDEEVNLPESGIALERNISEDKDVINWLKSLCKDKKKVEEVLDELEEELNITSVIDKDKVIQKIIEFNCDKEKLNKWYEDYLSKSYKN